MRCSGHLANLQSGSFIEMSLKLVSDVLVGIEIFFGKGLRSHWGWRLKGKKIHSRKKVVEKRWSGTSGVNHKQLFAMVTLRLHFHMAFLGIHAVRARGCASPGDLCVRTEPLLFADGALIIADAFYPIPRLRLEARSGSTDPVVCVNRFCSVRFLKFVQKNLLELRKC